MRHRAVAIPFLALVLALMAALGALPAAAQDADPEGPRAVVAQPVADAGSVARGQKVSHAFEIRNDGRAALEITQVKPTCGCTVAEYDRQIAPGAAGTVRAVIDTKSFRGPIAKSVQVFTNDPENPRLNLVLKANVYARVEAEPGYARFVTVEGEGRQTSIQTMWSSEKPDLQVLGVESPYPFVKASHREASGDERQPGIEGRQWRLEITLEPDAPVGPLADYLKVRTNHPQQRLYELPVSGFVRPVLSVVPRIADFGRRELTEPQTASLEIKNLSSSAVELSAATTDLRGLAAELESVEAGRLYKLLLTLEPGMTAGPFEGVVRITTTSRRQPLLEVSVKGVVL